MQKMCCVVKMSKGVEKKKKKRKTRTVCGMCCTGEYVFPHETYGCTSWRSHTVAVISAFILSSLPFVSHFYWIAPLLPLHPVFVSLISLYRHRDISHLVSERVRATHTRTHTHTKAQSLTKLIIGKIHSWSNSHPKTSWQTLKHPCDLCVCVCVLSV